MARVTIIQGHPDPAGGRLCHALAEAYAEGAAEGGHELRRIELGGLDVPILRSQDAFEHEPVPPQLADAQEAIRWAEHLLIVFPLWQGTMPALLKAFFEQVFRPDFAMAYDDKGRAQRLLAGRSARIVVTMGMPALVYRWYFRAHGLRGLERSLLRFVGIKPVRESLFGMVEAASAERRAGWLAEIRARGRSAN